MADARDTNLFDEVAPEVRRFLSAKTSRPSDSWRDTAPEEHAAAFTVARTAGYDVLGDIRKAVEQAVARRQSFEEFRAGLEPVLQAKGWWGAKVDPTTGETVQLGSPRRLKTIYWANVRSAYAAGEWEKTERARRVLPYLIYVESTAREKRPEHLAWVGTILPVDDPWWEEHYPPNGWGCMCRVRQISEREALEAGYRPEQRPADFGRRTDVNLRTGEVTEVPVGVDPGWSSNPGRARMRNLADVIAGRVEAMSEEARRAATADLAGSWLTQRILAGAFAYTPRDADPANRQRGEVASVVAALPEGLASSRVVRLTVADAVDLTTGERDLSRLQALIDRGVARREGARIEIRGEVDGVALRAELIDDGRAVRLVKFAAE